MKRVRRLALWTLTAAGLFALLGLTRVPAGHVARRTGVGGDDAVLDAGLHLGLWGWHTWELAPRRGTLALGAGARPPLQLTTADGHPLTISAVIDFTRRTPDAAAVDALARRLAERLAREPLASLTAGAPRAALVTTLPEALSDATLSVGHVALGPLRLSAGAERATDDRVVRALRTEAGEARAAAEAAEAVAAEAEATASEATRAARAEVDAEEAGLRRAAEARAARVRDEAAAYAESVRLDASQASEVRQAERALALAEVDAQSERAMAAALAGPGGRWLIALQAIEAHGAIEPDAALRQRSLADWKAHFTDGLKPEPTPTTPHPE